MDKKEAQELLTLLLDALEVVSRTPTKLMRVEVEGYVGNKVYKCFADLDGSGIYRALMETTICKSLEVKDD